MMTPFNKTRTNSMPRSIGVLLLMFFVFFTSLDTFSQTQTFTASGSFTVPAGITSVTVECWGGGGRGGSRTSGSNGYGGGGGGAYAKKNTITVTSGSSYTVTVGTGSTTATSPGGDSWFLNNTTVLAKGGASVADNSATGATGGAIATSIGDVKYAGGNGSNSTTTYGGAGGSSAGTGANGTTVVNTATAGAAPAGGGKGGNGASTNGNGNAGSTPGGGGGGALRTSGSPTGGNGANGQVIITWSCSSTLTSISATTNQTKCLGLAIDTIIYNIAGATGANVTGLPTGVSAAYTNGVVKITGTPTVTGTFNYTVTPTGSCTSSTATGRIVINASPSASAGTALSSICIGGTSAALGGSVSGAATSGTWSSSVAGGSFSPNATTLNATYTPPAAYTGTLTLTLTTTGGSCGTATASKTLTVNPQPTASISYSVSNLCKNAANLAVNLTGTTGGIFSSTSGLSINSSTGLINPALSTAGTYTITYTIAAANGCNAASSTTNITIIQDNFVFTYPSISYCTGSAASVSVSQQTAPSGGSYFSSPAGLDINPTTGQINVNTSTPGNYIVKYQFTGGTCSNIDSTNFNIILLPTVTCPANFATCLTATPFALTGATPLGGTYSGNGVSGGVFNPNTAGIGTHTITYTYSNGNGCPATCSFTINVTNSSINITATPANSYVYTGNYATIALNSTVAGTQYTWTATANNPNVTGFSSQATPTPNSINQQLFNGSPLIGEVTYTITPSLVGCTGSPVTVIISLPSSTFCESPGSFQRGSCIINMGVVPQTYNNGIKPYGLLYQLLNVNKIPVYWCVNSNKTFETSLPKVDQADFTVDGITFKGGPFVIPASYVSSVQTVINSWVAQGVVVHYTTTSFSPPVFQLLTRIPQVVLDARFGTTIKTDFYDRAGLPASSYTLGGVPTSITNCDDIYVLPHAEPQLWTTLYKDSLLNFINNRGWLYSSCKAVSGIENIPGLNFLSSTGLISDSLHVDGTPPYNYSLGRGLEANSIASDPFAQFVGTVDQATNRGYETIFLPKTTWRASTKIAIYDSNFVNVGRSWTNFQANNPTPYPNTAAILAYGRAFGNSSKGMVLYLAGHDFSTNNITSDVAAARVYANFILRAGIGTSPIINPLSIPTSANSGETINLSVSIPPSTSTIVQTEWSSDLNGVFSSQTAVTTFTPPAVNVVTICTVQFKATDACGRTGLFCTTIIINPTIKNNNIGASQTICSGIAPATLTGTLPEAPNGGAISYLWLMSTTGPASGFVAATGTNNTQNYTSPALTQTTWFRRQVSSNGISVSSTSVQVTVTRGPLFTTQPNTLGQSVCTGGTLAALTVATSEIGATYQWYSNTTANNVSGTILSGATSSLYTPSSALPGTTYYYCVITSATGCKSTSDVSGAIVITSSLLITTQFPTTRQNICKGTSSLVLSVLPVGAGISYQWYRATDSSNATLPRQAISGATSSTFVPDSIGSFYYYCRVSIVNSTCSGAAIAFSRVTPLITVKVSPFPGINNLTGSTVITCERRDILLQGTCLNATSFGGVTYQWNNNLGASADVDVDTSGTFTVTVRGDNGCTKDSSIVILWGISGSTWTGEDDSRWDDRHNWCGGVPDQNSDVIIPSGTPNDPVISFATGKVRSITLNPGTHVTLDGQTLLVYGNINSNGNINAVNGTIELKGTSTQNISGSMFESNMIGNLRIGNPFLVNITGANDTLKLRGTLDFNVSNATLNANGNLTLLSGASGTARVADMTNNGLFEGNRIVGDVTVERYIPNHSKAWQLLSVPTSGGRTIKDAWQEGNAALSNVNNPTYGTIVTSNLGGNAAGNAALGFDIYTPTGATLKTYNPNDSSWVGVSSTNIPITSSKGYMILVRGDRSVTAYNQAATATKMRTSGMLYQSFENPPSDISVQANRFESVGNPFASAIDLSKLIRTGGVQDVYYVWDPKLTTLGAGSAYGLGGYQNIVRSGNSYTVIPGGGSYANGNVNIESGQAFLVRAYGTAGTVSFAENQKTVGGALVTRNTDFVHELGVKLSVIYSGTPVLIDGALSQYEDNYSSDINGDDAYKINSGSNENIAVIRNGVKLVAEKRHSIVAGDTIYYNIGQLKRLSYQLQFNESNLINTGLTAEVVDKFTGIHTPLLTDSSTVLPFTVTTDPATYAADRFYVVLRQAAVLPVTIHAISAKRNEHKSTTVNWKSDNEISVDAYQVERSLDGRRFETIATVAPKLNNGGSTSYSFVDENAPSSIIYYRIKARSNSGLVQYSLIVEVKEIQSATGISIYPNPVENKIAHLYFEKMPLGEYQIKVYNSNGQLMGLHSKKIITTLAKVSLELDRELPSGDYKLEIISASGEITTKNILIK